MSLICKLVGHAWRGRLFGFSRRCLRCDRYEIRETHRVGWEPLDPTERSRARTRLEAIRTALKETPQ